jgi:hypothetical protein
MCALSRLAQQCPLGIVSGLHHNNRTAETEAKFCNEHLRRETFSGAQFRDRSAKFYRIFKETDSTTVP